MLVQVVKEFDLKLNGVNLVGSNPAVSVILSRKVDF